MQNKKENNKIIHIQAHHTFPYHPIQGNKMPTIIITGDTTQEALERLLIQGIGKYGKEFNVQISENLRFENQNEEVRKLKKQRDEAYDKLGEWDAQID